MNKITKTLPLSILSITTTAYGSGFDVSGIDTIATSGYDTAVSILGFILAPVIAWAGFSFFKRQMEWSTLRNILVGSAIILLAPKIAEFIIDALK